MAGRRRAALALAGLATITSVVWWRGRETDHGTWSYVPPEKAIGVVRGPDPFHLTLDPHAVLEEDAVTDVPAQYVTDPFVVRHGGRWLMFHSVRKVADDLGAIAVATSADGVDWTYGGIVLEEPFHTSYPHVFQVEDTWYMTPETASSASVSLYRATAFPRDWELVDVLLTGDVTDPTPFVHDSRWWMFVGTGSSANDRLSLYMADRVTGPWSEHPASPVVDGDANIARPGGRVVQYDGRTYRIAQDDSPLYGSGVRAVEIVELTSSTYREEPVGTDHLVAAGDEYWTNIGLGHLDLVQLGPEEWIGYVTGQGLADDDRG